MRYLAILFGLLLAPAFLSAQEISISLLSAELCALSTVPRAVCAAAPTRIKWVHLPSGAFAQWNPHKDTFEIPKQYWKQTAQHDAICLLPLLAHESVHARLHKEAQARGFAWPVTLQDEVLAYYYQLTVEKALPNFAQKCSAWQAQLTAERTALAAHNWSDFQTAVLTRYSQFYGAELPPPPFTQTWINEALHARNTLPFYHHTYKLSPRTRNLKRLWKKGGSWLQLSPNALRTLAEDTTYHTYKKMMEEYRREIPLD